MRRLASLGLALIGFVIASGVNAYPNDLNNQFTKRNVKGSITIYDTTTKKWYFSDREDASVGTLPASTFKIANSLIALEEKVVSKDTILKWDGIAKKFKGKTVQAWNKDTNIEQAFKNSTIWFFVEISKRIPINIYKKYLSTIQYGNLDLEETGDDFWNYGNLKISPINQIEIINKLIEGTLPFSKKNMEIVKSFMLLDTTKDYSLYGKTGWASKDGSDIGWFVGYLEKGNTKYVFATRIIVPTEECPKNFSQIRKELTSDVFREMGFIK